MVGVILTVYSVVVHYLPYYKPVQSQGSLILTLMGILSSAHKIT